MTVTVFSLDEFRATGRDVENLGLALGFDHMWGTAGRIYRGYWIGRSADGWYVHLGSKPPFDGPLVDLEEKLYKFISEQMRGFALVAPVSTPTLPAQAREEAAPVPRWRLDYCECCGQVIRGNP